MSIIIRKAEKYDINALSELYYEFIGVDSDKAAMEDVLDKISTNPNYAVFVSCDGSKVIGTAEAPLSKASTIRLFFR